jgi:regulator of protease activity HflC (stomatin/prohibitin superfamily)
MRFRSVVSVSVSAVVGIVALVTIFSSFYTVDQGERAVVLRWGEAQSIAGPGGHFKIPFVQDVRKIKTRVQCVEWSGAKKMQAYSKDQQPAELSLKVCYQPNTDDKSIIDLYSNYRDVDGYASAIITPNALESTKAVFGNYDAVTSIQSRARLNTDIVAKLTSLKGPVLIQSVQLQNVKFSNAYEDSVEDRMKAQVEVEKFAQNKEREQLQAEIKVIQAKATAEAIRQRGEAEAAAIKARGDALRENPNLVKLIAAEKWDGKLPATQVPGSAVPFIEIPNQ